MIKCMYFAKRFHEKPKGYETGQIQNSFKPVEIEIEELADGLSHGTTFKPAYLTGRKKEDWVSQQVFALDFDGGTTIEEQKRRCTELNILPTFGYTSFSHTEQEHHFRLVFCSDKLITDANQRDMFQNLLIKLFDKSDKVANDRPRLFYGGKQIIHFDYENRIDVNKILNEYGGNVPEEKSLPNSDKIIQHITVSQDAIHLKKIEAIKFLDVNAMQQLLKLHTDKKGTTSIGMDFQQEPATVKCAADLHSFIKQIDLEEYLGIYGYVSCILPEHKDDNPSAHIYTTDDGTQVYKCFGCGKAFTITSVTEKLANCSRKQAIEFLCKVYGIVLQESDWTKEWKNNLVDCAKYLDSDDFKITFPKLSALIRTRKKHLQSLLLYFTDYVSEDLQANGKPIFFASYSKLMSICGIKKDKNAISQTLTLFSLLNMIIKMQVEDIPEKELKKAQSIAAKYGHTKLTGFYSFSEYGTILFEGSEIIAQTLKDNHMTLKGISREYVLRTFGVNLANIVFPQYRYENEHYGTSRKTNKYTEIIAKTMLNLIDKQNYVMEKEIYSHFRSGKKCELQYKKSIQEIFDTYGLAKVKASKTNKKNMVLKPIYHINQM